jgi:ketosteroid isomerase-like protein
VQARIVTAEAVATLHRLNAERIVAWARRDLAWCRAHLAEDFVSVLADGRRVDKAGYLGLAVETSGAADGSSEEVDVHLLGKVALIRGVARYRYGDSDVSMRYTDVWVERGGGWVIVSAHFTALGPATPVAREERATSLRRRGRRSLRTILR